MWCMWWLVLQMVMRLRWRLLDCAGVCGGDAVVGGCDNVCGSTAVDYLYGVCGGWSTLDDCGDCVGHHIVITEWHKFCICDEATCRFKWWDCGGTVVVGGVI